MILCSLSRLTFVPKNPFADLTGANLRNADLTGAMLDGAKLDKADLSGAIGLPEHLRKRH